VSRRAAALPGVENRRRPDAAVGDRHDEEAQFVDRAGGEEGAVDPPAALEEQPADPEARLELPQDRRDVDAVSSAE
jgi:hypothetical protein